MFLEEYDVIVVGAGHAGCEAAAAAANTTGSIDWVCSSLTHATATARNAAFGGAANGTLQGRFAPSECK